MLKQRYIKLLLIIMMGSIAAILLNYYWLVQLPALSSENIAEHTVNWELPKLTPVNVQAAYDKLKKQSPWGTEKAVDDKNKETKEADKSKESHWKLAGIIQEGNQRYALLASDNNEFKRYAENETLPNNAVLLKIADNRIELKNNDTVTTLQLYAVLTKTP